jgi:hypothetical protein
MLSQSSSVRQATVAINSRQLVSKISEQLQNLGAVPMVEKAGETPLLQRKSIMPSDGEHKQHIV